MIDLISSEQAENAQKLRKLISIYQENQDLLLMGGYVQGQDADLDQAVQKWPDIVKFLHQDKHAKISFADANKMMSELVA
jgi:flagellum-specific ATP synthase